MKFLIKRYLILFFVTFIGIFAGDRIGINFKHNLAYAASPAVKNSEMYTDPSNENTEKSKALFSYELAQITGKLITSDTTNPEDFKIEFSYAMAKATEKMMMLVPDVQRSEFSYQMAKTTAKIMNDPNLNVEKAKAEFSYQMAQLTARVITNAGPVGNNPAINNRVVSGSGSLLRNNAEIEVPKVGKQDTSVKQKPNAPPANISQDTYRQLVNDLEEVGNRSSKVDHSVNIDGELRSHYIFNSGPGTWGRDQSGMRLRLGFDTKLYGDWIFHGMLEGQASFLNYRNDFRMPYRYLTGKLGVPDVKVGWFGYTMAEGNIYDSTFRGIRFDINGPLKYTLSQGQTDYTKNITTAAVRFEDFDYNLEAGVYHYQTDGNASNKNTILTLAANYKFENFDLGAMLLKTNSNHNGQNTGYVFAFNYGALKTYRADSRDAFIKYYNQPQGTYIMHGMNGMGGSGAMQGFRGYGVGSHYTIIPNLVAGLEYFNLTDKVTGEKANTLWSDITYYF